jgi:hypothetical protein
MGLTQGSSVVQELFFGMESLNQTRVRLLDASSYSFFAWKAASLASCRIAFSLAPGQ